jgi:hypothetical protein
LRRTWTFFQFLSNRSRQEELAREGREIIAHIRALGERLAEYPVEKAVKMKEATEKQG